MKKVIWPLLYVLLAVLFALTVYLYMIPEFDTLTGEATAATTEEEWVEIPRITLNGVEVEVGETTMQPLLDSGLTIRFEQDGKFYRLDTGEASAKPNMQYSVYLCNGEDIVASVRYTNLQDAPCIPGECEIDYLEFDTSSSGFGSVPVLFEGTDMTTFTLDQITEKFPDFTKVSSDVPEYRKTAISSRQSMVAYIRGAEDGGNRIASFGVRNYMPGTSKQDAAEKG